MQKNGKNIDEESGGPQQFDEIDENRGNLESV